MGRAPCCEKMGLKKGPWTKDEDQKLIDYINRNGHGNWRALPKRAGLLRCGKSCRLRWMNYLRPDIKRGNFTTDEEDNIIKLHELLGNRWSAIAARLPGRTDNEIKNVWHTHLKKKLKNNHDGPLRVPKGQSPIQPSKFEQETAEEDDSSSSHKIFPRTTNEMGPNSPQSSSDISSVTTNADEIDADTNTNNTDMNGERVEDFPEIDESFWSDVFSADDSSRVTSNINVSPVNINSNSEQKFALDYSMEETYGFDVSNMDHGMDFWYDLFTRAEEMLELPGF